MNLGWGSCNGTRLRSCRHQREMIEAVWREVSNVADPIASGYRAPWRDAEDNIAVQRFDMEAVLPSNPRR